MITDGAKIIRAEAYANHICEIVKRKHTLEEQIAHQREEMGLIGIALGERVFVSPTADAIPDAVARLMDMIGEYVSAVADYVDEINEFNNAIKQLTANYRLLLYYRYVELLDWQDIADRINYSERHMYRLKCDALLGLYALMPGEWRIAKCAG